MLRMRKVRRTLLSLELVLCDGGVEGIHWDGGVRGHSFKFVLMLSTSVLEMVKPAGKERLPAVFLRECSTLLGS